MAEPPTLPNTPLHRYVPNTQSNDHEEERLPSGACNFTNLNTVGGSAPRCGCRRFWDKSGAQSGRGRSGFCMCEHHACFHDEAPEGQSGRGDVVMSGGSIPRRNLSAEMRLQNEQSVPNTLQWSRYIHSGSHLGGLPAIPSQCLLPSDNGSMTSGSQAAGTYHRPFGGLGLSSLAHIPEDGGNQTAAEKIAEVGGRKMTIYEDASGNGFLQSLTDVATPRSQDACHNDGGKNVVGVKGTERSQTPRTTVALRPVKEDVPSQVYIKQSGSLPGLDSLIPNDTQDGYLIPRLKHIVGHLADYPTKIENHEQRLELLENASFSNAAVDDLQDANDRLDNRVGELEERMVDLEKVQHAMNDASSFHGTCDSRASNTSSAMIVAAIEHIDVSRVEALEAQVAELQASALPSHSRPWEVEVVFLPFGTDLQGIWSSQHSMTQRSRLNSTATDEWTQTQHSMALAQAHLTAHDQASAWENSAMNLGDQEDTTWLMAKACADRSRVHERLRSRGLVRTIQVFGPDSRDIQSAMLTAFCDLPDLLAEDPYTPRLNENAGSVPKSLRRYLGLQYSWIPLRKLHKDSRLRFLNPSEMVTPALWTTTFLTSSVAMRHKSKPRLYITQRDAYIQHLTSHPTSWTWAKLRQLPRVYPEQTSTPHHTPEADAHEPCWEYDERLDPAPACNSLSLQSIHSSFASQLSIRSPPPSPNISPNQQELDVQDEQPESPSDHFSSAPPSPDRASTTPTSIAPPRSTFHSSPLKERNPFRAMHTRTLSAPLKTSSSQHPKRRNPSSESSPPRRSTSSISTLNANQLSTSTSARTEFNPPLNLRIETALKRRRTRSPSRSRAAFAQTPRWSLGPPSPFPVYDELNPAGVQRDKTPFAYATPHSNAPYFERRDGEGEGIEVYEDGSEEGEEERALSDFDDEGEEEDDGEDNEVEEELGQERQVEGEEEWEGVSAPDEHAENNFGSRFEYELEPGAEGSQSYESRSEFPSKVLVGSVFGSGGKGKGNGIGFRIHVDEDEDE